MAKKVARKYFVMRVGKKEAVFTGRTPRQAALKAASRGYKDIKLRERGRRNRDRTYSIHVFKGSVRVVDAPADRPTWLPAKVKKPNVSKVGVERITKV